MKGILYILISYFLGELLSFLIGGFIPGTILGMVVMFCALSFKVFKVKDVEKVADAILGNMMVLFVPISVGIMIAASTIGDNFIKIVVILLLTTALVIGSVALMQQKFGKKKK